MKQTGERRAGVRAGAVAGATNFFTMAYIAVVNPSILSAEGTGMPLGGVLTATVLVCFTMTLLMLVGLAVTAALARRRSPFAYPAGIFAVTLAAWALGKVQRLFPRSHSFATRYKTRNRFSATSSTSGSAF